jgi:GR25 family glycosyltransferase involved in LPS biosynthesis
MNMKIEHAYILYIDDPDSIRYMEDCKKSCEEHGIPVTPFLGFKLPTTVKEVYDKWGFKIDPRVEEEQDKNPVMKIWFKEQLCLTGHLALWNKVANEHKGAVAIFEHDAIVKRNFLDVEVNDLEWLFLGYRVDHRDDYECISDPFEIKEIFKFEGTHAYALTPKTASSCLIALSKYDENKGYLPIGVSIDHMMGVTNAFKFPLRVVDPAPAIAAIENKISYTQPDEKTARYNMIPHDGFLKGLKNTEKYKVDYKNNWLVF